MNFEALDGTKLLILMIAGAVFAAVGLFLMVRPKVGDAAKIEIFGLKFESSSAGLLVFVIGAAFLSVPLFAPEKAARPGAAAAGGAAPNAKPPALRLPEDAQVTEQEPNDRVQGANIIAFGQTVAGDILVGEEDWYVIALPPDAPREVSLQLRHVGGGWVNAQLFNGAEVELDSGGSREKNSDYLVADVGSNKQFFVRVTGQQYSKRGYYELRLSEK